MPDAPITALPPPARARLLARFGPAAGAWCDALPGQVAALAERWGVEPLAAGGGGTSRVFRCRRHADDRAVWLKVTPDPQVAAEEAEALAGWERTPSVAALLAADPGAGALLLDGVEPGTPVRGREWELGQVAALLRELRESGPAEGPGGRSALRPLAHRVGFLFDLALRRAGPDGPDAEIRLRRARAQALELAASTPEARLVHGDLHAANVLHGPGGRLVAIDPRPAWGDPDFDAVDWVLDGVSGAEVLRERAVALADLVPGLSTDRVRAWAHALGALPAASAARAGRDDARTRFLLELGG
ncbi:phosphotransferase [Streptomyces sp. SID8014]|uniref:aminoglycoside phosphotransferase family protein n=1 Tax=Streptomyces sp. SID8014 TaxID=2706097 RepID=UPI0013B74288|nr:phosphotransferase [Streptomyces sp. SID8014]